jgi:transcriptional regulator
VRASHRAANEDHVQFAVRFSRVSRFNPASRRLGVAKTPVVDTILKTRPDRALRVGFRGPCPCRDGEHPPANVNCGFNMLIRKWDAALADDEWHEFLRLQDFGQFVASGRNRDTPIIVPTHFVYDGRETISFHLARANPVWPALEENARAVMSVVAAYTYIPTDVNGGREEPAEYGVPTSYYAAVQAQGTCEVLDGDELVPILRSQLGHFQPNGGHAAVEAGDNPYAKQFAAIRGIRLSIDEVRAKFKFGGNKTREHRTTIAEWLAQQQGERPAEARDNLLRRMSVTDP